METKKEVKFTQGFIFKKPRENAPEFVKGNISIKVDEFVKFLQENVKEDGWINIDLLKSKDKGTLYTTLNDWKPMPKIEDKGIDYPKSTGEPAF